MSTAGLYVAVPDNDEAKRAFLKDDGRWSIWWFAIIDGRMRLTSTPPKRAWTERELDEDPTRAFKIRRVGMFLGPFTSAYVTARLVAIEILGAPA